MTFENELTSPQNPSEVLPLVCTVVTAARLAYARVLARSIARFNNGEQLRVLLLDDSPTEMPHDDDIVFLDTESLKIDQSYFHQLAGCVSGADLAAAIAPDLVAQLLKLHRDRTVAYVDANVVLLAPLDDLGMIALHSGVALVPRLLHPAPLDAKTPDLAEVGARGAINAGIVVVAQKAMAFCQSWSDMVAVQATQEDSQIAKSQPLMDLLVADERVELVRDEGHGVAYWNAHERIEVLGEYEAGDAPVLRSVHLEGFAPFQPYLLSTESGNRPRVLLSENKRLAVICREFADALRQEGVTRGLPDVAFRHLENGDLLDHRMRRIYRKELRKAHATKQQRPPDPFGETKLFYEWLCSGDPDAQEAPLLPRYLAEIRRDRADLIWHFPRVGSIDALHFREWVEHHGLDEESVPVELRAALARSRWWAAPQGMRIVGPEDLRDGAVIVGFLRAESGIGEAARLLQLACTEAGVEVTAAPLMSPSSRETVNVADLGIADRKINLLWVNAEQVPHVAAVLGPSFFEGRYTIGGWYWESEQLPDRFGQSAEFLDEIWVPSEYVSNAIASKVNCPVYVFPHPMVVPEIAPNFDIASLGVRGHPFFLFTYDMLSSFERKNPLGVFEAFSRAFPEGSGPVLLLKSVNGVRRPNELERLRLATQGRSDVVIHDGYLSATENAALLAQCDCYVSLHRAEGLGLGMAEAMALGKPVIATKYSGNLEFMNEHCAWMVPAKRIKVGRGAWPYEQDDYWGDPDIEIATSFMRRVVDAPEDARLLGQRARQEVLAQSRKEHSLQFVQSRFDKIQQELKHGYQSSIRSEIWQSL